MIWSKISLRYDGLASIGKLCSPNLLKRHEYYVYIFL
ncbi:unnamed protein product [Arabidopsis halleri]